MDEDLHRFVPADEDALETERITARCSCGWTGGTYPVDEGGYQEARDDFQAHQLGTAEELEAPS